MSSAERATAWWQAVPGWLGRSLVVGLVYPLAMAGGGAVAGALGAPTPAIASRADPVLLLVANLVTGFGSALVLGPLASRLSLSLPGRALAVLGLLFGVGNALNMIEALFFTRYITVKDLLSLPGLLVGLALVALLLAWLFPTTGSRPGLLAASRAFFGQRHWASWAWRLLLAGGLYVPTYLTFGMLVAPVVLPAYQATGTNLAVPGFTVMVPLEIGRGLLYVACVLPVVVGWRGSTWTLAAWLGLAIAALGGWLPMLTIGFFPAEFQFPPLLRVVHGLEITADSAVQGVTIAWLLVAGLDHRRAARRQPPAPEPRQAALSA